MKVTGIIAEYNPFHKGHNYQIESIKNNGTDYVVVIMSGDFVQRGEPAILDKYTRTRMALNCGADLVIELPTVYALEYSSIFASGAVNILDKMGIIDNLSFGIEKEAFNTLECFAEFFKKDNWVFENSLKNNLKSGLSYPLARSKALLDYFPSDQVDILVGSNTILALDYIIALSNIKSNIIATPIIRNGKNYNDTTITSTEFSSASAIRKAFSDISQIDIAKSQLPSSNLELFNEAKIILPNDFSSLLHYKLMSEDDFTCYLNVKEGLSCRINNHKNTFSDIDQFSHILKTKNITYSSIKRLLMHILLNIKEKNIKAHDYIRILGFKKEASALLSEMKQKASLPIITKLADADINDKLKTDIMAANIYEALISDKYNTEFVNEYSKQIVIV